MPLPITVEQDGEEFDLILHTKKGGEDGLEIVDEDIEVLLAAEALGIELPESFWLWCAYSSQGIDEFIQRFPLVLYEAFEDKGYDVFSDEQYNRSEFLDEVSFKLRSAYENNLEEYIEILEDAVRQGYYDKDEFIEDLIEGLKTIYESDGIIEMEEEYGILILQKLVYLLPEGSIKLISPVTYVEDYNEAEFTEYTGNYSVIMNDEEVMSWGRTFRFVIKDPISLDTELVDLCETDPESWGPPMLARALMEMMGWTYSEPNIELPDIPESVSTGDWGVLYETYEMIVDESIGYHTYRSGKIIETQVVEYETKSDAMEAADISSGIIRSVHNHDAYDISVVHWNEDKQVWDKIGSW